MNQELKKQSCSGKKIDFILQELFREANTLSVKLYDPNSKNLVLDAKLLVEEMREQIHFAMSYRALVRAIRPLLQW